ncbi:DinB family protein [Larkinella sp. GY13]|uniref:DinB family protein n=1 Tax=Larkinella sp. GY13 TaxID=3453720 RepID=UPI003EEB0BF6
MSTPKPEVWQRGPVAGVPSLLQPVAHALLQAREEVDALMKDFPSRYLWQKPAGVASVGFHLQHLTGVLDRLFTYARNEGLSPEQRAWLAAEGKSFESENPVLDLISRFNSQVDQALQQLAGTDEQTLTDFRGIGRAQLPSTVLGLLFHSAEHTQRHVGQLFVTVRVLLTYPKPDH